MGKMNLKFVTLKTFFLREENARNVTICKGRNGATLLGNLEHGTNLIIDQELVDSLQEIVDEENSNDD